MTGIETWNIVAPILAVHGHTNPNGLDLFDEAYVMVYSALKYWDEHKEDNDSLDRCPVCGRKTSEGKNGIGKICFDCVNKKRGIKL